MSFEWNINYKFFDKHGKLFKHIMGLILLLSLCVFFFLLCSALANIKNYWACFISGKDFRKTTLYSYLKLNYSVVVDFFGLLFADLYTSLLPSEREHIWNPGQSCVIVSRNSGEDGFLEREIIFGLHDTSVICKFTHFFFPQPTAMGSLTVVRFSKSLPRSAPSL